MKKCADAMTAWLIRNNVIEKEDQELYAYAAYSFLMTISPLLLALLFGAIMRCIDQSVILIIPFMVIRKFSGGYHAKHPWTCMTGSCLLLLLCIILSSRVACGISLAIVTAGAVTSLILCSPVESENRRLEKWEKRRYKVIAAVLSSAFYMIFLLLFMLEIDTYAVCVAIGILLSAALQIPCLLHV